MQLQQVDACTSFEPHTFTAWSVGTGSHSASGFRAWGSFWLWLFSFFPCLFQTNCTYFSHLLFFKPGPCNSVNYSALRGYLGQAYVLGFFVVAFKVFWGFLKSLTNVMIQSCSFYRHGMNSLFANMSHFMESLHIVKKVAVPRWLFPKNPVSFKDIWALECLHMSDWEYASSLWQL